MHLARARSLFFLAFLACALVAGVAVGLQDVVGTTPCPLCLVQRILMLACSLICLIAAVHTPGRKGWRVYSGFLAFIALMGIATAARQVWLQDFPPEDLAACFGNLRHLLDTQPFLDVLYLMLVGTAGCSEITWTLFGISLPEWSLLAFSGIGLFALYYLFIEFRQFGSMDSHLPD